jgi:hypothetical protein
MIADGSRGKSNNRAEGWIAAELRRESSGQASGHPRAKLSKVAKRGGGRLPDDQPPRLTMPPKRCLLPAIHPSTSRRKDSTMPDKAKPAHKIRSGALTVTIWKNDNEKGSWYSVTPSRSYKQNEEWKESDSFAFDDLMTLAKLLDLAHTWILTELAERKAA